MVPHFYIKTIYKNEVVMQCERCKIPMKIGIAIGEENSRMKGEICRYIVPTDTVLKDPLLLECWKCPKCGHSEYITTMQWFFWKILK